MYRPCQYVKLCCIVYPHARLLQTHLESDAWAWSADSERFEEVSPCPWRWFSVSEIPSQAVVCRAAPNKILGGAAGLTGSIYWNRCPPFMILRPPCSLCFQVFQRRETDEVRFTQVHTEIAALERRVILQYGIGFFGSVIAMGLAVARIAAL